MMKTKPQFSTNVSQTLVDSNKIKPKLGITNCTGDTHYKMIIPKEVEQKIRQTCNEIHDVEWSGILFYDYEGSFEENNLIIKCIDFLLMDIGTSAYTEFNDSRDTLDYAEKHPELYDHLHMQALIHSHNHMNTFFSGTDISTLQEWGAERNNFVSLIVNNAGTYTAAITRKVSSKRQVKETFFTKFFGEGEKAGNREYEEEVTERIEYFLLDIEKEESQEGIETHERIEEIRNRKEASKRIAVQHPNVTSYKYPNTDFDFEYKEDLFSNDPLFSKPNLKSTKIGSDFDLDLDDEDTLHRIYDSRDLESEVACDPNIIQGVLAQLLTGSVILSSDSKVDIKKWVSKMPTLYSKRFGKPVKGEVSSVFRDWAERYIEFLLMYTTDPSLQAIGYQDYEIQSILAEDLIEALYQVGSNIYISEFIAQLEYYLDLNSDTDSEVK